MSQLATKVYRLATSGNMEPCERVQLEEGQIIWLNGYGQSRYCHDRKVVFKLERTSFGLMYHAVNIDQEPPVITRYQDYTIRPVDQIFGIGTYYTPGDMFLGTKEELERMISSALEHERKMREFRDAEMQRTKELEDAGRKVWEDMKAKGAVSLIVAELREDRSDIMTDYFNSVTVKTVILGPSKHNRNNFRELRKLAGMSSIPGVAELATASEEYEHRENYSMGGGFYLGKSRYSGWQIRKVPPYSTHLQVLGGETIDDENR